MYGAPVDLSFKCLSSMTDALTEEPNQGLRPLKRNAEKKFCSRSLRLNNNIITDLSGFNNTVSAFLSEPSQLAWVDLSFNDISHIDPVLVELKELRVLYLHGNSICNLSEGVCDCCSASLEEVGLQCCNTAGANHGPGLASPRKPWKKHQEEPGRLTCHHRNGGRGDTIVMPTNQRVPEQQAYIRRPYD
eukprot:XP_014070758.1 PREDICTED: leucine-rich repeat-containing protein 51-like isoform X1 [Salmo salar]